MSNFFIEKIFEKNRSMQSREAMLNLYYLLREAEKVEGDVVEFGCYRGLSSVLFQMTLDQLHSKKQLFVYDSFQGLSEKCKSDFVSSSENMRPCDYKDNKRVQKGFFKTTEDELLSNFEAFKVTPPTICSGWVQETVPLKLPEKIAFIHLDLDLYAPCLHVLTHVMPRLTPGGILVVDDYSDVKQHGRQNAYPGVKAACDTHFKKPLELLSAGVDNYQAVYRQSFL